MYGVCSLDVLAVEAVDTGAVGTGDFVVATDARRKEVYLAAYDGDGARLDGPDGRPSPADVATERAGGGRGRRALPGRVPARRRPDAAERRLAGPGGRPRSGPSCTTPSRSTCAGPTPRCPGRPSASRDRPGRRRPADVAAIAASRRTTSAPTPGRTALVAEGVAGRLPTVHYLVAEVDGAVVGHAVASIVGRRRRAPADRRGPRPTGVPAWPPRCSTAVARARRRRRRGPAAARGPGGQRGRARLLRRRGFVEVDRRRRYYRDGATAVVLRSRSARWPSCTMGAA